MGQHCWGDRRGHSPKLWQQKRIWDTGLEQWQEKGLAFPHPLLYLPQTPSHTELQTSLSPLPYGHTQLPAHGPSGHRHGCSTLLCHSCVSRGLCAQPLTSTCVIYCPCSHAQTVHAYISDIVTARYHHKCVTHTHCSGPHHTRPSTAATGVRTAAPRTLSVTPVPRVHRQCSHSDRERYV